VNSFTTCSPFACNTVDVVIMGSDLGVPFGTTLRCFVVGEVVFFCFVLI
jgi:hypothetical protein